MVVCIPATTSGRKRVFFNHKWSNKDRFRPQVVKIGSNSTTSGQPKNATKSGKSTPHKDHIGFSNYGSVCGCASALFPRAAAAPDCSGVVCWIEVLTPNLSVAGAWAYSVGPRSRSRACHWPRGPLGPGPAALGFLDAVALVLQGRQAFAGRICGS